MGILRELFGEPLPCHDGHADTLLVEPPDEDAPSSDTPQQHARLAAVLAHLRATGRQEMAARVAQAYARRYSKEDGPQEGNEEDAPPPDDSAT